MAEQLDFFASVETTNSAGTTKQRKYLATRAITRVLGAALTPGVGESVVHCQQFEAVAFASVMSGGAVTLTAGQRAGDGAGEVVLQANPKRVGLRIRVKAGPVYLGGDDQVDAPDGMFLQATESFTLDGYTGPLYAADDGTHPVDLRVWEWSTP
jgi:hypothetical protein